MCHIIPALSAPIQLEHHWTTAAGRIFVYEYADGIFVFFVLLHVRHGADSQRYRGGSFRTTLVPVHHGRSMVYCAGRNRIHRKPLGVKILSRALDAVNNGRTSV